jgi:hypothetical protein
MTLETLTLGRNGSEEGGEGAIGAPAAPFPQASGGVLITYLVFLLFLLSSRILPS